MVGRKGKSFILLRQFHSYIGMTVITNILKTKIFANLGENAYFKLF